MLHFHKIIIYCKNIHLELIFLQTAINSPCDVRGDSIDPQLDTINLQKTATMV